MVINEIIRMVIGRIAMVIGMKIHRIHWLRTVKHWLRTVRARVLSFPWYDCWWGYFKSGKIGYCQSGRIDCCLFYMIDWFIWATLRYKPSNWNSCYISHLKSCYISHCCYQTHHDFEPVAFFNNQQFITPVYHRIHLYFPSFNDSHLLNYSFCLRYYSDHMTFHLPLLQK